MTDRLAAEVRAALPYARGAAFKGGALLALWRHIHAAESALARAPGPGRDAALAAALAAFRASGPVARRNAS